MTRIAILALLGCATFNGQVSVKQDGAGRVQVAIDGHPFTGFVFGPEVTKPYLDPIRSASGVIVTRRFPMQTILGETTDHPEHRGVWFGHTDVNGFNFYANEKSFTTPNRGTIVVKRIDLLESGKESGTIEATLAWLDPSGKTLLLEKRRMVFHAGQPNRIVDFDFTLTPSVTVRFGDHRDGLFSMRLADALQEPSPKLPSSPPRTGLMTSSTGCKHETGCWGKSANWMDYSGAIRGQSLGVAIFDHPDNPGHPTHWQVRGYGLFAANIFGLREFTGGAIPDGGQTFQPHQRLRFRYRMIVHPGNAGDAHLAAEYERYAASK